MTLIHLVVNDTTDWSSGKQRCGTRDDIFTDPAILQTLPVFPLTRSANSKSMGFFCFCSFRHPHCVVVLSAPCCVCVCKSLWICHQDRGLSQNVFFFLMWGCKRCEEANISNGVTVRPFDLLKARVDLRIWKVLQLYSPIFSLRSQRKLQSWRSGR